MQASKDPTSNKPKKVSALSISRLGAYSIIMSLAVFACIAAVTLVPGDNQFRMVSMNKSLMPQIGHEASNFEMPMPKKRFLQSDSNNFDNPVQVYQPEVNNLAGSNEIEMLK